MVVADSPVEKAENPTESADERRWRLIRRWAAVAYFLILIAFCIVIGIPQDRQGLLLWTVIGLGELEPPAPGIAAEHRVGDVRLQRRPCRGPGVFGPDTVRSAEVRDAAVGRDSRTGEDGDFLAVTDQLRSATDCRIEP